MPIFSPNRHGVYDGNLISLHVYLKFCLNSLFSPFILYEPYLLIIYDLGKSM
jgi:hypothetical protein